MWAVRVGRYKDTIPGTRRRSVSRPDRYLRVQCGPVVGTFVFFTEEMAKRLRPQSAVEFVILNRRILFYYAILPFFLVIVAAARVRLPPPPPPRPQPPIGRSAGCYFVAPPPPLGPPRRGTARGTQYYVLRDRSAVSEFRILTDNPRSGARSLHFSSRHSITDNKMRPFAAENLP